MPYDPQAYLTFAVLIVPVTVYLAAVIFAVHRMN
jgi:hypothetical protein